MIAPSLGHVLLSVPIFGFGWATASYAGPHWAAALLVTAYWFGREFAQSYRPSTMRLVWTWTSTRNFVQPAGAAVLVAGIIEALLYRSAL